jgi:UDP-N-acetyl-D-mannosaminuronic acid dehydrogenase
MVNNARMPFKENGAEPLLQKVLSEGNFQATTVMSKITNCEFLFIVIGTPVDEHLNPDPSSILKSIEPYVKFINSDTRIILRSTVYPGVTARVSSYLSKSLPGINVSFCPERIAEGHSLTELRNLPQIVGTTSTSEFKLLQELFASIGIESLISTPEEAELAKLFTNAWRYIKFAGANQFFMMSTDFGVNFSSVRNLMTYKYPRASDFPSAGFAAGPCLFKDTMQLASFARNNFPLGNSAMLVNEGLPLYLVEKLRLKFDLPNLNIGILGMAFKPEIDDPRSSLSYKLRKVLIHNCKNVYCHDEYITDPRFLTLDEILKISDILIIATPHKSYSNIKTSKPVIDIWNLLSEEVGF